MNNNSFTITVLMIILAISTTLYLSFKYHNMHENRVIFQNTELIRFQKDIKKHDLWLTEHEIKIQKMKTQYYQDMEDFKKVVKWLELSARKGKNENN